jgi:hypothetical protein
VLNLPGVLTQKDAIHIREMAEKTLPGKRVLVITNGAILNGLPSHTRLVLVAEDILAQWGTRTADGYRISADWGEQRPEGWYEPTFTVDYTDRLGGE